MAMPLTLTGFALSVSGLKEVGLGVIIAGAVTWAIFAVLAIGKDANSLKHVRT